MPTFMLHFIARGKRFKTPSSRASTAAFVTNA